MTRQTANEIKKFINTEKHYQTYYNSKSEVSRVLVNQYYDGRAEQAAETKKRIQEVLVKLQNNGLRPRFEIEHKRYQGFINCIYLIFR